MGIIPTGIPEILSAANDGYLLKQNFPNPFNGKTTISFEIPNTEHVSLKVYDILGEEVAELAGKEYSQGVHSVEFASGNLPGGIYFCWLKAGMFSSSKKMVIQEL